MTQANSRDATAHVPQFHCVCVSVYVFDFLSERESEVCTIILIFRILQLRLMLFVPFQSRLERHNTCLDHVLQDTRALERVHILRLKDVRERSLVRLILKVDEVVLQQVREHLHLHFDE